MYDQLSLSVARVENLDIVEAFVGEQSPALGSSLALSLDESQLLTVRARSGNERVAVYCTARVRVDDPEIVSVLPFPEDSACEASGGSPAGSWVGLKSKARGKTRLRLTLGEIETVVQLVVD